MAPRSSISAAIISSVVPPLTQRLSEVLHGLLGVEPLVVGPGLRTGLDIRYEDPREVGADRIVNAVGALTRYQPPLIIIDSGTATTFDVLLAPNIYAGGIIVPGLYIARDALTERTAMLPKVELRATERVLGRNTADSIRSGMFHGSGAMVDGLVHKLCAELDIQPTVIAAGGMGALLAEAAAVIQHVEPDLTLIGLREIWLRNQ